MAASRKLTRSAWRISPALASSAFTSSGVIGRPAASAEAQSRGRSAFDLRSQAAVASAYHWPPSLYEKKLSQSRHAPFSTTSTWRSPHTLGSLHWPSSLTIFQSWGNGKRCWLAGALVQSRRSE